MNLNIETNKIQLEDSDTKNEKGDSDKNIYAIEPNNEETYLEYFKNMTNDENYLLKMEQEKEKSEEEKNKTDDLEIKDEDEEKKKEKKKKMRE